MSCYKSTGKCQGGIEACESPDIKYIAKSLECDSDCTGHELCDRCAVIARIEEFPGDPIIMMRSISTSCSGT